MELNPSESEADSILSSFLSVWPVERVSSMTLLEYSDLSDHNSFCYWVEYRSKSLGAIGGVGLQKFEIWKTNGAKSYDRSLETDSEFVWRTKKGDTASKAFFEIRELIVQVIQYAQQGNAEAIDNIPFHAIGKWKIAFLYSQKRFLPIYSKRPLLAIAKGLGQEFEYKTPVPQLQQYILKFKEQEENIFDFAYRVYTQFGEKERGKNFYIFGSNYGDSNGTIPMIRDFLKYDSVGIGFLDWIDFSPYMGADKRTVQSFVSKHWVNPKPTLSKVQRTFSLLSQIKEGDIIAVKSHGNFNRLTIIAYAEVTKRNGVVYEHNEDGLGHQIHVNFLDAGFSKNVGLNYAETIHQLTLKKGENFHKVFGWYGGENQLALEEEVSIVNDESGYEEDIYDAGHNEKSEVPYERNGTSSVIVNRIHNRIQNQFVKYLQQTYPNDLISGEKKQIDARRETANDIYIYEIKPFESVYACVRAGIGQLLDYSHKQKNKKNKHLIIVGPNPPGLDDLAFISSVKDILKTRFSYIAFNDAAMSAAEF